ncbi:MAG: maleylpyruvate isomerase family mycothiol-dependent enzyme [Pseudonocardia sp.]
MTRLTRAELVARVAEAHERERSLIGGLTDDQVRAPSTLPGWTRSHVLAALLAFAQAANRQITFAMADRVVDFYDGGREGRDEEIETNASRSADDLVLEVVRATKDLDRAWARLRPPDWSRPVRYRDGGSMTDVLRACWREAELHAVDLDLGVLPSEWSADFCVDLFDFLTPRAPEGVVLELFTPEGDLWKLGSGEPVRITGTLTDLAAWLAGRAPVGEVRSSTGELPTLRRLRDARR